MTGSGVQLRALFGLRWQMVRSDGVRVGLVLVVVGLGWLLLLIARGAGSLDPIEAATAVELAPEVFLGFGVLALIAPLTAGGGNEIIPPDQLVAYPVRPRTQFVGGLVLAPLNLVWVVQILVLVAETALLTQGGHALVGGVTTVTYVAALTAVGQALAWLVVGLRQSRTGRQAVALLGGVLLLGVAVVVKAGLGHAALDHAPTGFVVDAVVAGARGDLTRWALTTGVLAVTTGLALHLGERTCTWALRRPGDAGATHSSKAVRRRLSRGGPLRTLLAVDRASVWRAPALRRGALVLAILPGLGAAGARVPWESLAVLPGLVAAGAGLLFGINAFCLDGSGAVYLASLPHDPRLVARAKALVLTETVLAAVVLAAVAGSLRSPGSPTSTQLIGIVTAGLACTAVVVTRGMSASVRRPHHAVLAGPRDAVAPPGALALASVRLALPTALVAIVIQASTTPEVWWLPLAVATVVLLMCWLSLARTFARWADPRIRAHIMQTVASG